MKIREVRLERRVNTGQQYEFQHYTLTATPDEDESLETLGSDLRLAMGKLVGDLGGSKPTLEALKKRFGDEVSIRKQGGRTYIQFKWGCPHFNEIKAAVKELGCRWDPEAKLWEVNP